MTNFTKQSKLSMLGGEEIFKIKNKKPKLDIHYDKAECIVVKLCPLFDEEIDENDSENLEEQQKINFFQKITKFFQKLCHY
jgi:hypothetical protein